MKAERRPPFAALGGQDPSRLFAALPTPCYLLDEGTLRRNGELLAGVAERTGCRILLAQKAFSNYDCYPLPALWLRRDGGALVPLRSFGYDDFKARLGSAR